MGADCGCGGRGPMCAGIGGSLLAHHAFVIRQAAKAAGLLDGSPRGKKKTGKPKKQGKVKRNRR